MTQNIGAPGDGMSRRAFLAATGATGAALAGCTAPTRQNNQNKKGGAAAQSDVPLTSPPEVVNVHEQGVRSR